MTRIGSAALGWLFCISALAADQAPPKWNEVDSWVYQLTNYPKGKLDRIAQADFDLAVVDLSRDGGADYFTKAEVSAVKQSGKIVLSYFEIGAIENYRPEWKDVPKDLMAGAVDGWPDEQYVRYWDERWWPVVRGRIDQAIRAGFNGAYLDMITTYEEIPGTGIALEERARRMVALIARISSHAKKQAPGFKIVPQNCPELYTWSPWSGIPNKTYLRAINGIGIEGVFFLAHDKPATAGWCREVRENALAIRRQGKLVLGIDYARKAANITEAYRRQRKLGFVPYVGVVALDRIFGEPR
jgi:cysteinyl-tRNA synthetase